uniref:NADH dehydrogenase subunit 6 n=1 Tax=Brachionus koreanus TaxID=1199090 RepID=R4J9A9_9BILA|nr:NADH dehydrogenase subunit 6 [Brachionus koreanus]
MMIFLSFYFLSLMVFVNTLYYSMVLLIIVLSSMFFLVSNHLMHTLTMLMLAIVYIGAMMILIGYICAISPNMILTPLFLGAAYYVVYGLFVNTILPLNHTLVIDQSFIPMTNFFYSSVGFSVFSLLVFMLFITLLMVTSQYMTPKGPFRAVVI